MADLENKITSAASKKASGIKPGKNEKAKSEGAVEKMKNTVRKAGKYIRDCRGEIKRIVWPTPKATFKSTGVVLVVMLVSCIFVSLLDIGFMNLLSLVMNVAK